MQTARRHGTYLKNSSFGSESKRMGNADSPEQLRLQFGQNDSRFLYMYINGWNGRRYT